jgi:hypothetical protein
MILTRVHNIRIVAALTRVHGHGGQDYFWPESTRNKIQAMGPGLATQISNPNLRNTPISALSSQHISEQVLNEYNPASGTIRIIQASITISSGRTSLSWPGLNDELDGTVNSILSNILADVLSNSANLAEYEVILDTSFGEIVATVTVRIESLNVFI